MSERKINNYIDKKIKRFNNENEIKKTFFIDEEFKTKVYRFAKFVCERPHLYKTIFNRSTGYRISKDKYNKLNNSDEIKHIHQEERVFANRCHMSFINSVIKYIKRNY